MAARIEGYVQHRLNSYQRTKLASNSEANFDQSRRSDSEGNNAFAEAGFYLVSNDASEEFLLSIPQNLIKQVCDAARFHYLIQISDYRVIPLGPSSSQVGRKRPYQEISSKTSFLEIHNQGLQIIQVAPQQPSLESDNFLSLKKILALEKQYAKEQLETEPKNGEKKGKKRSPRYNVKATVDAISPIILVDQKDDPFALMELYDDIDESGNPCSCIVVLQGKASLLCHEGIFPGDIITLRQVKRQRWKMLDQVIQRKVFHLKHRVPTHVFLLKDAKDVGWQYPLRSEQTMLLPPLPSTPIPLVALQGRVVSREWARHASSSSSSSTSESRRLSYILHSIRIQLLHKENKSGEGGSAKAEDCGTNHILFLTYFPMAPSLALSLRPDAIVRAVNIHCIGRSMGAPADGTVTYFYAACLRSTVSILQVVPPSYIEKNIESLYEYYPSQPYAFRRTIEKSCLEYACRKVLHEWYERNFLEASSSDQSMPNFQEIATIWTTNMSNWNPGDSRNPYMEFCDHACDEDDDNKRVGDSGRAWIGECTTKIIKRDGCHVAMLDSACIRELPVWATLSDLRQKCTSAFHGRLQKILQGDEPPVGWTASIIYADQELLQVLRDRTSDGADCEKYVDAPGTLPSRSPPIYAGGIVRGNTSSIRSPSTDSHERMTSVSLGDRQCTLPVTVLVSGEKNPVNAPSSETFHGTNSATFAYGLLNSVVASCICLGAAPGIEPLPQKPKAASDQNSDQNDNSQGRTYAKNPYKMQSPHRHDVVPIKLYGEDVQTESNPSSLGACSLVQAQGLLFVVSIQLNLVALVPFSSGRPTKATKRASESQVTVKTSNTWDGKEPVKSKPMFYTIQQCLDPGVTSPLEETIRPNNSFIMGFLARQRFRVVKIKNNQYSGCVMTLAHIPINQAKGEEICSEGYLSCVQSIEVKTAIHFENATKMRDFLKKQISKLLPEETLVGDDPANIALAWWKTADSKDHCPLTAGGWDNFLSANNASKRSDRNLCITVQLPATAALSGESRGYKRFSCSLDDMRARFCEVSIEEGGPNSLEARDDLPDFTGGFKFLPGMLDRRPCRVIQKADVATRYQKLHSSFLPSVNSGELMTLPKALQSGILECHLSDLLRCICLDLQTLQSQPTKNRNLAPSLVRKTFGARFLGVSFCQARAMCAKCFAPLKYGKVAKQSQASKMKHAGKSKSKDKDRSFWQEGNEQPSFWHCPLPIPTEALTDRPHTKDTSFTNTAKTETVEINKGAVQLAKESTSLCCPKKGCCVQSYGEIKWECSGTLDDGTGQAKLYAEREAATLLLGMCRSTIDNIEEGVWKHKDGAITFSKTIPPPSHLAKAVEGANFKYLAQDRFYKKLRHSKYGTSAVQPEKRNVLSFLEPVDRAIYLMYQHCRHSHRVNRPLDYLVRCKPMADNIIHLNHTEIDIVSPGPREGTPTVSNVATYSLPPLKLNLVDCCSAAPSSGASVVDETWELVQLLQRDATKD